MNQLTGKVAIITGAGEGIGRGIARRFAAEGAAVVIAEINPATGQATAREIEKDFHTKALFVMTDVSVKEDVLAMVDTTVKTFGRVDILVNNAWGGPAVTSIARLQHMADVEMEAAMRLGLLAAFWAMQAVFPHMRRNGGGRIISICSLNGINAHMFTVQYNCTKEALRTLTRSAAREWAKYNILANIICPGAATAAYQTYAKANPEDAARVLKFVPLGWMGDPERDIGGVALFLASEDSRYVTGNTIHADGGGHINGVPWGHDMMLPD